MVPLTYTFCSYNCLHPVCTDPTEPEIDPPPSDATIGECVQSLLLCVVLWASQCSAFYLSVCACVLGVDVHMCVHVGIGVN